MIPSSCKSSPSTARLLGLSRYSSVCRKHSEQNAKSALHYVLLSSDRLRRLDIAYGLMHGDTVTLPANPLPALTHLFLFFHWTHDLRMPHILSLLASAPSLEMVHLSQFTLSANEEPNGQHASVPHLKHRISSNKSRLTSGLALLRRLVVPGSARTYLNINSKTPVSVLPILPSTADTERLTVFTQKRVELMVSARCSYSEFWLYASDYFYWNDSDRFPAWLTHLPTMSPLSSLSHLQLRLECPGSAIVQLPRATPVLTTLEFEMYEYYEHLPNTPSDGDDDHLIRVCSALSSETSDSEPLPCICPQLQFLTLVLSVHCDTKRETYTCWLADIHSMTLARARLGRPLRRLSVQPVEVQLDSILLAHAVWAERVEDVLAEYSASLAAHVEDLVLHRPGEDTIAFAEPGAQWDEVERYWTVAQLDQLLFYYD